MWRLTRVLSLLALVPLALCAGCEPIDRAPAAPDRVETELLADPLLVPGEFGELVDITTTPGYREDFAQLWFRSSEDGTIRVVYYHFKDRALDQRVDVIRRGLTTGLDALPDEEDTP